MCLTSSVLLEIGASAERSPSEASERRPRNSFIRSACAFILLSFLSPASLNAFTQVQLGPNVPESVEQNFLADTTAQWLGTLTSNAFFPNTYTFVLTGPNTAFNPPPSNIDLLNAVITVDSYTYVYGWADGMSYDRASNMQLIANIEGQCASSTTFIVDGSTWNTVYVDTATCRAVLNESWQQLYQLNYASPTVVPGFRSDYVGP
jgi:hypothetical protein